MQAVLSCPAIAENCLLEASAFEMADFDTEFAPNLQLPGLRGFAKSSGEADPLKRHFELIRTYAVGALRRRELPLWMRIVLIGFLSKRLDAIRALEDLNAQDVQLSSALLSLDENRRSGAFADSMKAVTDPTQGAVRQEIIQELSMARLSMQGLTLGGVTSVVFLKLFARAFEGFGFKEGDLVGNAQRFARCESEFFQPFEATAPTILENYLVHQVMADLFPSAAGKAADQWVQIVARYAMVRFYLIGLAGSYREDFAPKHAVELIYSFSRAVQHSNMFLKQIETVLRSKGFDNLGTMAMLVRGPG
jgi:lysine-N-methylase